MNLLQRVCRLPTLLLAQAAYFFIFARWPARVENDNTFYEVPALRLVQGDGFSMPASMFADPTVVGWICKAQPAHCLADAYPTATYPPGYGFFVAAHYAVFGRSPSVVMLTHLLLLMAFCVLAAKLAQKLTGERGTTFVIGTLCVYPFIARQAAIFSSDHLHLVLVTAAFAAWHLLEKGVLRGIAFGAAMIAATLTRPYTVLALGLIFVAWPLWKKNGATRGEWLAASAAVAIPWGAWIVRNYHWFGRVVPLTTTGLGATLYSMVLESEVGSIYQPGNDVVTFERLNQFGRFAYIEPNKMLMAASTTWMQEHPLRTLGLLAWHAPKLWISLGMQGEGLGIQAVMMGVPLLALFVLGLWGAWRIRRDARFWPLMILVVLYWGFLLPSPEARRTLPLRLPMLLFAGAGIATMKRTPPVNTPA